MEMIPLKGGHLQAAHVRDLRGVIEREKAAIGVLLSMEAPTKPRLKEAAGDGFYQPPGLANKFPRLQLFSIEDLLAGKRVEYPRLLDLTYKKAPKAKAPALKNESLRFGDPDIEEPF